MPGNNKIKIELGAVQETLLLPLWARAVESRKPNPIVLDSYAGKILDRIDYDFSKIEAGQAADHQIVWAIRAYNFDRIVSAFLADVRGAAVINIGAGLDTTYQRIDDGYVLWVNIDLPDVVALRQKLIPDSEREITVARSVFDFGWMDDIEAMTTGRGVMFIASGVFCYFTGEEVKNLFRRLANAYPSAHVVFDSLSRFAAWGTNRSIMKESGMASSALIRWHLKRASELRKWVDSLKVIEEFPVLSKLPPKNDLKRRTLWGLKIASLFNLYNMIHVQL